MSELVVLLHTREYLEEHGHSVRLYDENPSIESIPILCIRLTRYSYIIRRSNTILYDYMVSELYEADEAKKLFPEVFI